MTSRHGNPRLHNAQVVPLWDDVPAAMATGHLQPVSYVAPQGGGGGRGGGGGGRGGPIMMKDQQHSTTGLTETVMINSGMWKSGWHVFSLRFFNLPLSSLPPLSLIHLSSFPPSHLLHPSPYFVGHNHLGRYGVPQPKVRSLLHSVAVVTSPFFHLQMPFNGMVISTASSTPPLPRLLPTPSPPPKKR